MLGKFSFKCSEFSYVKYPCSNYYWKSMQYSKVLQQYSLIEIIILILISLQLPDWLCHLFVAQSVSQETSRPSSLHGDEETTAKLGMHILHLWKDTCTGWHLNIAARVIRATERAGVYQATLTSSSLHKKKIAKVIRPPDKSKQSTFQGTWWFWDGLRNFPGFNFMSAFLDTICTPWSSFSPLIHFSYRFWTESSWYFM